MNTHDTTAIETQQDAYYAKAAEVRQALLALIATVNQHGAIAAKGGYPWAHVGDLNALLTHIQDVPIVLEV